MVSQIQTNAIQITAAAGKTVRELLAARQLDDSYALRIYIAGRTCTGFQYGMALDNKPQETDSIFEVDGIKLLVDEVSMQYMLGATVDYIDDERGKGFMVDNPNALPACDCGQAGNCGTSEN